MSAAGQEHLFIFCNGADAFAVAVFRADVVETLPRLADLCLEGREEG